MPPIWSILVILIASYIFSFLGVVVFSRLKFLKPEIQHGKPGEKVADKKDNREGKGLIAKFTDRFKKSKTGLPAPEMISLFVAIFTILSNFFLQSLPNGSITSKELEKIKKQYEVKIQELNKRVVDTEKKWTPQPWTIYGYIVEENSPLYKGIYVNYLPPSPGLKISEVDGRFDLYNVKICKATEWPTLQFSCNGYFPDTYEISDRNAKINEDKKEISLIKKIRLDPH
jgi:hypothetical protein